MFVDFCALPTQKIKFFVRKTFSSEMNGNEEIRVRWLQIFSNDPPKVEAAADDPTASDVRDKTRATNDHRSVNLAGHFVAHYFELKLPLPSLTLHHQLHDESIAA